MWIIVLFSFSIEPYSPTVKLIQLLREQKSRELVNFGSLSPHLMANGLLAQFEYNDITNRNGYSPAKSFLAVVNEILPKAGRGNVVKKFIQALQGEKNHTGHKELLKIVESKLTGMYSKV